MPPSDSLPPSALAPVSLAFGLPLAEALVLCRIDGVPTSTTFDPPEILNRALRVPGLLPRGVGRASQVPGPSSSCAPGPATPPGAPRPSPSGGRGTTAFGPVKTLGSRENRGFEAVTATARTLACSRIAVTISGNVAESASDLPGSALVGRASHPLDDKLSFRVASVTPIPSDQPFLVALTVTVTATRPRTTADGRRPTVHGTRVAITGRPRRPGSPCLTCWTFDVLPLPNAPPVPATVEPPLPFTWTCPAFRDRRPCSVSVVP